MNRVSFALAAAVVLAAAPAFAEVANIKVVTDANPDYSDMESMVHSITANWTSDYDKMYALFYWDHIARRQTNPMMVHGYALTDPIRQYNDYGFTMCSTISGIKCSTWNYMGYPCRYFDIGNHTVCDVWYEGRFHHYDNSLSMYYTLPDGKTIASVEDVGKTLAGPETNGKPVAGYIALYHAVTGTGPNGFCQGADTERPLSQIVGDFKPNVLKYRYYLYDQDRGHRYILNLRDGEVYTRFYSRQDAKSPNAVSQSEKSSGSGYKADPAYFVPNGTKDPESSNPRYHIRGNGERTWTPILDSSHLAEEVYESTNIAASGNGLSTADTSKPGTAIFKVEGANVITSLKIRTDATGQAGLAISTTNGKDWKEIDGDIKDLKLIDEVNGSYEVLVKVTLQPGASLKSIAFDTITEINAHTQPELHLGKNTVYVGAGDQSESIVVWPELKDGNYKKYVFEESNLATGKFNGWQGVLHYDEGGKEGYMIYKFDTPTDITSFTYGGRMYNRDAKSHIDFSHSYDGGKTWKQDYTFNDTKAPYDVIHYETVSDVPAGTKSVLLKYSLSGPGAWDIKKGSMGICSLYAIRMEVDHKLANPTTTPVEVTFNWQERQKDYSTVKRSHTQVVDKLPGTYTIDVGGDDQPIVDSLTVNLKGSRPDVKVGYSDGKDVGGEKWVGQWVTYGKDLAMGKAYTVSAPPAEKKSVWGANDDSGKRLTDGRVGSSYTAGVNFSEGPGWNKGANPEITVDLGEPQKLAAFRIHFLGYPAQDAIKGEIKDKVEVLTSDDGKDYKSAGNFDFNLHWKDIPVNYVWNDEETFNAYNHTLTLPSPVTARYVKFKVNNARTLVITEVQALDSIEFKPFDLKIALPDPASNGKPAPKADVSPNARKWAEGEALPKTIGKQFAGEKGSGESPIPGAANKAESEE